MLLCASMVIGSAVPAFAAETESSAEAYTETISVTEDELEEADAEETSNEADNEAEEAPEESQEESQDEPEDEPEESQDEPEASQDESEDEPEETQDEESQDESEDEPEETRDEESRDGSEDESKDDRDENEDESEDDRDEPEDTQDQESLDDADSADKESGDDADSADEAASEKENADSENSNKYEITLYDDNRFPENVTVTFPKTASAGEEVEITIDDLTDDQYIFWVQYNYVNAYGHGEADRVSGGADSGFCVYSLTMPEHDICIVIDIENKTPITVEETEYGTITVDPEKAATDETIRLTAEAEAGYVLDEWTVMGYKDDFDQPIRVSDDCFKIGIPFDSVTVSAKFVEDPDCYSITVDDLIPENVAVNCPAAAKAGEEVKIEITGLTEDQYIHWIRFTKTEGEGIGEAVKVSGDADSGCVYSFTMPESDILLFLDIQNRTPITLEETEHGTIAVSSEKAEVNEKIRLIAEPEPGYMLDAWTVMGYKDGYGQPLLVKNDADEDGTEYFAIGIPFENVTVSAKFVEDPDCYSITVDDLIPENVAVNCPAAAKAGEEVKIEITGLTEDQYIYWVRFTKTESEGIGEAVKVSGDADSGCVYSFIMPESDILLFPNIQNRTPITVEQVEHGTIAVSSEKAEVNEKIRLIAEPEPGYVLGEWTVTGYRDNYGQPLRVEKDPEVEGSEAGSTSGEGSEGEVSEGEVSEGEVSEGEVSEGEGSEYFEMGIPFENVVVSAVFVPQKETTVDVNILWNDEENAEKKRPENVIVHLFADGQEVNADGTPLAEGQTGADGAILTEERNGADGRQQAEGQTGAGIVITPDKDGVWKHSFTGLPATRLVDGKVSVITYSVTQEEVPEYRTEINGLNITNTYVGPEVIISYATASFGESFKLNFYFRIPDSVMKDEGACLKFTGGSTPETVSLQSAEKTEDGMYCFSHYLVASELRDQINVQLFNGKGQKIRVLNETKESDYTDTGISYSLITYCERMIKKSPGSDMAKLAKATIDYCTAAQIYFEYNADGLSVSDAVQAVTLDNLSSYKATATGTLPEGVSIKGLTLTFETDNTLRVYYGFDEDKDPYSYSYTVDGHPAQLQRRETDGSFYLTIGSVPAYHLGDTHTYTISDGTCTHTVTASGMSYGYTSVDQKDNSDRRNLGKALLLYYQAAVRYFG